MWGLAAVVLAPGLAVGSFLNVVAARIPVRRSIVSPGSACPSLRNEPRVVRQRAARVVRGAARSLPPLRRRRSRGATRRSRQLTALLVAGCALKFGLHLGLRWSARRSAPSLVAISATDLERRIIPNRIVLPAAVVLLAAQTVLDPSVEWAAAGLGAAAFFLLAALAYPGGMGMGDVKLALLLGVVLGRTVPVALADRHARRARPVVRAAREARPGGAQDDDPVWAVPRARRCCRALRREPDPRLVSEVL